MKTRHHSFECDLRMHGPDGSPVAVRATEVAVDLLDGTASIARCFLTFAVSPDVYRRIDTGGLFHLAPDARGPIFGGELTPDQAVEIEAKLAPNLVFEVSTRLKTVEALAERLIELSQGDQAEEPLLDTENWFALYVKQAVAVPPELGEGTLKVGYRTLWADS